jgi:hypothetical protein
MQKVEGSSPFIRFGEAPLSRHGIPHLAAKLVGETSEELEADAAAKAAWAKPQVSVSSVGKRR